jgi:hypothetical protein
MLARFVLLGLCLVGCDQGGLLDAGHRSDALEGVDAPRLDAPGLDAPRLDAPGLDAPGSDVPGADAPRDVGRSDGGRDGGGGGPDLDPLLDVPPATATPCGSPGNLSECPGIAVCRFYSSTEGRCESCDACGNLFAPCSSGEDCDILFVCYAGRCTNFCTLGSFECGAPGDCLDVGHPTRGACRPS